MRRRRRRGPGLYGAMARLLFLAAAGAALLSCPEPVDQALLRVVEDQIDPVITVVQPKANSFYKTRIAVTGTLEDSSSQEGDHLGALGSLEVKIPNTATLNRTVTFAEDGTYSVSPEDRTFTYEPASGAFGLEISAVDLSGPQLLTFLLTDRNGNATELTISLFDDPTGPHIELQSPESYSTYGLIVNIAGKVTNADNDPSTSNVERISWELPGTSPATGELYLGPGSPHSNGDGTYTNGTFTFDSADGSFTDQLSTFGRSGTLTFVFRAVDYGGDESETAVSLIDANIAPEVQNLVYPQQYSSAATTDITVSGTVTPAELPYFAYTVVDGSPPVVAEPIGAPDTSTGAFSFTFGVSANYLSGTLTVTISAEDSGNRDSHSSFNIYDDPVPPTIVTGTLAADNSYVDVTFDDAVYSTDAGTGALQAADLAVDFQAGGSPVSLAGYTVSRTDGTALQGGEQTIRVALAYTGTPTGVETVEVHPAAGSVYDDVGNEALTTTSTGIRLLADQLAAAVQFVTSPSPDGSYKANDAIDVAVRFSEAVYVTGTPTLTLETGATDRQAVYQSGHGTATLTFRYTVQPGDVSGDLDYAAADSLAGTIRDAAGNAANLALPAPGTPQSLAGARDIVVDTSAPAAPSVTILDGGDGLISIGENSGVQVTISGEADTTYLIGLTNAFLVGGNSGTLTGGVATRTFTASSDGLVALSVTLTDAAGNTGSPGSGSTTADLTPPSPPSVALADGPDGYISPAENSAGVGVTITGAAGCSYAITPTNAVIAGGNTGILSGGTDVRTFSAAANGPVTLSVILTDPAGNTGGSTAASSFAYITPPAPPVVLILDGDELINSSESGSGVDFTISGLAGTTYTITPVNATVSGALTGTLTSGAATRTLSAIASGTVSVSAILEDPLGSSSAAGADSSYADLSPPSAPSVSIADGDGWINLQESSGVDVTITGESGTTYAISLSNASLSGGSSGTLTGGSVIRTITVAGGGTVMVSATLTDAAGNQGSEGSATSTADLSVPGKPTVTIDDKNGTIDSGENSAGVPLKIDGESGATYSLTLTNCTVEEGTGGSLPGGGSVTLTLHAVADGFVEVQATLTDAAGNQSAPGTDDSVASGL